MGNLSFCLIELQNNSLFRELTPTDEVITSDEKLPIYTPGQLLLFAETKFESRLLAYLSKTYQVQVQIDLMLRRTTHRKVKMTGKSDAVGKTYKELLGLISRCRTKTYDAKTGEMIDFGVVDIVSLSS